MATTHPYDEVAGALAGALPSGATVAAKPKADAVVPASEAIVASFVGATSADLAVVLSDPASLLAGADTSIVSTEDVLRPALDAAAGMLGTGVLGDVRVEDAQALFEDETTAVFELLAKKAVIGWFAIRVRENGTVASTSRFVPGNLGRISNVEMALTVEIGRTRMAVRDVLALEPGAVIELDRSAGSPADVLLNGRLIAHGEVVVVDQDYAVRITKILDVAEGVA